jgi:hypothetical protein
MGVEMDSVVEEAEGQVEGVEGAEDEVEVEGAETSLVHLTIKLLS